MSEDFRLDAKAIAKNAPVLLRGEAEKLINKINDLDLNHDGKKDLAQMAKIAFALMPVADKLNDVVDFEKLAAFVAEQPFIKDKKLAAEVIRQVCHAIESK